MLLAAHNNDNIQFKILFVYQLHKGTSRTHIKCIKLGLIPQNIYKDFLLKKESENGMHTRISSIQGMIYDLIM